MIRALLLVLTAMAALLPGGAAFAQAGAQAGAQSGARVVMTSSWTEEWDPATQRWVRVDDNPPAFTAASLAPAITTTTRKGGVTITETVRTAPADFHARPLRADRDFGGGAHYGPFRVIDEGRAALIGSTDGSSPQDFAAMLAAHPGLKVIEFVDAPGTTNDLANLAVGRKIRAAGLATHVPTGGSARSGAVELFLAGTDRTVAPGALFAVHSWRDERGREPSDFAPDAPENRLYLDYYTEMGMSEAEARAFYAMTNSVPHAGALWLEGTEMARWIAPDAAPVPARPAILAPMSVPPVKAVLAKLARAHHVGHDAVLTQPPVRLAYADLISSAPALQDRALPAIALLDSEAAFP